MTEYFYRGRVDLARHNILNAKALRSTFVKFPIEQDGDGTERGEEEDDERDVNLTEIDLSNQGNIATVNETAENTFEYSTCSDSEGTLSLNLLSHPIWNVLNECSKFNTSIFNGLIVKTFLGKLLMKL